MTTTLARQMARPARSATIPAVRARETPERAEPALCRQAREAMAMFADELSAHRYLERVLWPDGVYCPRCRSSAKVGKLNGASTRLGIYKCYGCRKTFSGLHGTFMSASHVPAHKWLQAMYLMQGGTKPIRAQQLGSILDVSFKTAASMLRRIGDSSRQAASGSGINGGHTGLAVDFVIRRPRRRPTVRSG